VKCKLSIDGAVMTKNWGITSTLLQWLKDPRLCRGSFGITVTYDMQLAREEGQSERDCHMVNAVFGEDTKELTQQLAKHALEAMHFGQPFEMEVNGKTMVTQCYLCNDLKALHQVLGCGGGSCSTTFFCPFCATHCKHKSIMPPKHEGEKCFSCIVTGEEVCNDLHVSRMTPSTMEALEKVMESLQDKGVNLHFSEFLFTREQVVHECTHFKVPIKNAQSQESLRSQLDKVRGSLLTSTSVATASAEVIISNLLKREVMATVNKRQLQKETVQALRARLLEIILVSILFPRY
jgi:hypothetical protein